MNPKERYYKHLRMIKKVLKPLPRRAMLHEYPFIKWFANSARKRSYLWSFRTREVVLAILIGSVVAFTPLYGFHIPGAFLFAFLFRANLAVSVGLQLIANNPFTAIPLLVFDYELGHKIFKFFNFLPEGLTLKGARACIAHICEDHNLINIIQKSTDVFEIMLVGGVVAGFIFGVVLIILYKLIAYFLQLRYLRIKEDYDNYVKSNLT